MSAASYPTTYFIHTDAGVALDQMSVYDWIESRVPGGHKSPFGRLLDFAYNIEYGAETSDQSALNLVYLLGYKRSPATSPSSAPRTSATTSSAATSCSHWRSRTRSTPHRAPAQSATAGG